MRLVVQHRRDITAYLTEATLFDDDERHTCRRQVLLSTAVDDIVLAYINRTTQNVRTHIGYQRYIAFLLVDLRQLLVVDLRSKDGVIGRDMEIVGILRDLVVRRDGIRAGRYFNCLTEALGFLQRFLAPYTGVEVRSLLLKQVKRNHAELQTCTAAEEQYAVTFRHIQQLLHQCLCLVHDRLEILRAVRDLQYGQTLTLEIDDRLCGLFDHFLRENTRTRIKIVLFHIV